MKKVIRFFRLKSFFIATFFMIMPFISKSTDNDNQFFQGQLTPWQKKNWQNMGVCNSGIEFLRDAQGKKFVLKYHSHYRYALNEVLGGLIASSINHNLVNQAIIAPSDFRKKNPYATLHSHALGKEVGTTEKNFIEIRSGLSWKNNLESIATHNDLAKIVAINLFLNDFDCHNYNLFFSRKHNKFCAIDKGLIFSYSECLASRAYSFLQELKNNDNILWGEIQSLAILKKTLRTLLNCYPPQKIYTEWESLAQQNNFPLSSQEKEEFLRTVTANYEQTKKVYKELEYITQNKFFIKAALITAQNTTINALATIGKTTKQYAQLLGEWGIGLVDSVSNGKVVV